jgi:hypothetical protein
MKHLFVYIAKTKMLLHNHSIHNLLADTFSLTYKYEIVRFNTFNINVPDFFLLCFIV